MRFITFINIRVLRPPSMDWKSSLRNEFPLACSLFFVVVVVCLFVCLFVCFFILQWLKGSKQAPHVFPLLKYPQHIDSEKCDWYQSSNPNALPYLFAEPTDRPVQLFVVLFVFTRYHIKVIQKALNAQQYWTSAIPSLPVNSKQLGQDKVNSLADPVGGHLG